MSAALADTELIDTELIDTGLFETGLIESGLMDTASVEIAPLRPAEPPITLTHRDRAILRAVAGGTAELLGGAHPNLFVDGLCCSDQMAARRLARAGLIARAVPAARGQRVPARLTPAGHQELLAG
jgi:hypothetical protein